MDNLLILVVGLGQCISLPTAAKATIFLAKLSCSSLEGNEDDTNQSKILQDQSKQWPMTTRG